MANFKDIKIFRLIKLCDDALLDNQSSELNKENVNEIVAQVEKAVKVIVKKLTFVIWLKILIRFIFRN